MTRTTAAALLVLATCTPCLPLALAFAASGVALALRD